MLSARVAQRKSAVNRAHSGVGRCGCPSTLSLTVLPRSLRRAALSGGGSSHLPINSHATYAVNLSDLELAVEPPLVVRSPLGDTAGQSPLHASGPVAFKYLMRTGMAASRSESSASLRIGHQSYKKISRGRHIETQPPIVRLSRTISPRRLPFIKAARKSPKAIADATAMRPIARLVRPKRNNSRRRRRYA